MSNNLELDPAAPRPPAPALLRQRRAPHVLNVAALVLAFAFVVVLSAGLTPNNDDFKHYWQASIHARTLGDPYAERLHPTAHQIPGLDPSTRFDDYIYPPLLAYLLQPLGYLDFPVAQQVWFWLNVGLLGLLVWLCMRLSGSRLAHTYYGVVALLAVLFPPTSICLQLGQLGIITSLLLVLAVLLGRRWPRAAGLALGFAAAIKIYPALFGFQFVRQRRSVIGWAVAGGAGVMLLGLLLWGGAPYAIYIDRIMLHNTAPYPIASEVNLSFVAFWLRLLTTTRYAMPLADLPPLALALSAICSLGLIGLCLRACWRQPHPPSYLLQSSIWLCAILLLWPASGFYNLVVLLLPMMLMARSFEDSPDPKLLRWLALATAALFIAPGWSNTMAGPIYQGVHRGLGVFLLSPAFYGLIGYQILLLVMAARDRRGAANAGV